ncbi:MAG TPA: DUF5916 domain-containing protein [Gemmatimonadales bacterium]
MQATCRRRARVPTGLVGLALVLTLPVSAQQASPRRNGQDPGSSSYRGHDTPAPTLQALERATPIQLDGRLDEEIWRRAPAGTGFRQQRPNDGAPATQPTEIRVVFDHQALYVGARMFDSLGAAGVRSQLVRRDQEVESDWIELTFDTYHDHVGRTIFAVNPSGVKQDAGQATSFADPSWDPVWDVATAIDSAGWTAEFRIPFSQLRFTRESDVWGLQVWRTASRLNERSMWAYWGIQEAGGPQRFGHVEGIRATAGQRPLEILPYAVAQYDALRPGPAGDPFYDGSTGRFRVGADLKYRLTSNLTLDATINPDFGQVEVDPAVVNLSAFETFFEEKRPFFIAGGGIFSFGGFSCYFCSNVSSLSMFYTRRIGRQPQGLLPEGTEYADVPDGSTILGAAKLTGRTQSGWTIGLLDAMTGREHAPIQTGGVAGSQEVEPFTNYAVARVKRDLRSGNLILGGIATSVVRDLDDPLLRSRLPVHAEALGLDWSWAWKNRSYRFMGNLGASNVVGDSAAILRLQHSSARYFQRPDRGHGGNGLFSDAYEPGATRLGGYGGYARLSKEAGDWLWETAVNFRSPGFEVNDLAFLTRADYFWMNANVFRQWARPTSWYRQLSFIVGGQQQFNFDGDRTDLQGQVFGRMELLNYWELGGFHILRPEVYDDRALRGGPVVRRPSNYFTSIFANSDGRKSISAELNLGTGKNAEGARGYEVGLGVRLRPASNVQIRLSPFYGRFASSQQYVQAIADPTATAFSGYRYVMSDLKQEDLALNTRLNMTFTPTLTLELFAQPLLSSVDYSRFKEFDAPRTTRKSVYGEDIGTIVAVRNAAGEVESYQIDPDGPGAAAQFHLDNPDFGFRSLRGNAVLRWEYRPGSTLYLVWTQDRSSFDPFSDRFDLSRDLDRLAAAKPNNIFLVKVSYWLNF